MDYWVLLGLIGPYGEDLAPLVVGGGRSRWRPLSKTRRAGLGPHPTELL